MTVPKRLNLVEIFPSFQGEGVLVGVPQIFLRLAGCNLSCSYCDTPEAREEPGFCRIYGWEGLVESTANPLPAGEILERTVSLWGPAMHSVSITGGEPLLQAEALTDLLARLKERGMPVYLDTNGTLPGELQKVVEWVDWIAMDLKLPYTQGGKDLLGMHLKFLEVAPRRKVFLKVVVEEATPEAELARFCRELVGRMGDVERIPVVLQPVTVPIVGGEGGRRRAEGARSKEEVATRGAADGGSREGVRRGAWKIGISGRRAAELAAVAAAYFREVRVIPQLHRAWGVK